MKHIARAWSISCIGLILATAPATAKDLAIGLPFRDGQKEWKAAQKAASELAKRGGAVGVKLVPRTASGTTVAEEIVRGTLAGGLLFGNGAAKLGLGADTQIYALPFTFTSDDQVEQVRNSLDSDVLAAVSKGPYEAMGFVGLGSALALSSSSLDTPQDWRERKLWVPQEWQGTDALTTAGLTTVATPAADVRKGMTSGDIDMVIAPPAIAVLKQWHRRAENVLTMPCAYLYGIWLVKDSELETVSLEQRQTLQALFDELGKSLAALAAARDRDARDVFDGFGIAISPGSAELIKQWPDWRRAFRAGKAPEELPRRSLLDRLDGLLEPADTEDGN